MFKIQEIIAGEFDGPLIADQYEIWMTGCRRLNNGRIGAELGTNEDKEQYQLEMSEEGATEFIRHLVHSLAYYKAKEDLQREDFPNETEVDIALTKLLEELRKPTK